VIEHAVRIITTDEYPQWDELVKKSPQGTIFHTSKWITTCSELFSKRGMIFGFYKKDQLFGGCLVYSYKKFYFFSIAESNPPLTPYGGYIFSPFESVQVRKNMYIQKKIITAINHEMMKMFNFITLINSPGLLDIRPFKWQGWKEIVNYCYIFPLSSNIEQQISKKTRWAINRANKSGIVIKQKWDKDIFWDLMVKTYHKHEKKPSFSQKMLFSLMEMIKDNQCGDMWIAETASGDIASAEIFIWDNQMAYRWSAASNPCYMNTGATSLLIFEIMTHLHKKGLKKFDMMAAGTPNLAKFTSGFNPQLVPYYVLQKKPEKYVFFESLLNFF
jgi:hypothetical protein